jgi:hypothetical protein
MHQGHQEQRRREEADRGIALDGIPRLRRSLEVLVGMAGDPVAGGESPGPLTARRPKESTAAR